MAKINTTKTKIAKAAWKLFHENGYDETTIDEIILQSGTSKGSFYHYYSSKDELLSALADIFDAQYEEAVAKLSADMHSFDKLLSLCYTVHDMIEKEISVNLLASLYSSQISLKGDRSLLNADRFYYQAIYSIVNEGQQRGQLAEDMSAQDIASLYSMCERAIIYDYCLADGSYSLSKKTREIMPKILSCIRK